MGKAAKAAPGAGAVTPARRALFLKVLGETGNASEAARAAGVKRGTPYNLKRRDEWFARDWAEAMASAPARIRARKPGDLQTIRRSAGGRTQLAAVRAIGRNPNTAWRRRRECPDFARRFEAALGDAEVRLEYALVDYANNLVDRAADALDPAPDDAGAGPQGDTITPVEASFALQVLKWLDARKAGQRRGARRHGPKEPSIEDVRDEVIRKLSAIRRHRERFGPPDAAGEDRADG